MRLEIKKGFYWSAGKQHNWMEKYDRRGVGISMSVLQNNEEVEVVVGHTVYTLDCQQAITFIKHFKSIESFKGTKVGIVSKSLLKEILKPVEEVIHIVEEKKDLQGTLF